MAQVASDLIGNIESYQQHLTTLALGASAGTFAVVVQVIIHNSTEGSKPVVLEGVCYMTAAIALLFASILAGILTKSTLVAAVPALHTINWTGSSATVQLKGAGLGNILTFAILQVAGFAFGILALCIALFCNLKLVS